MTSALRRPHVLIVSDDRDLVEFLGEGLVYAGFWTSTIANALQALEVFRLRSFDIVLVDAAMGGIGPRELVRRLRGISDRAAGGARTDVPIVVLAASPDEVDLRHVEASLVDDTIVAPVELAELARRLSLHVESWRAAHPDRRWADDEAQAP